MSLGDAMDEVQPAVDSTRDDQGRSTVRPVSSSPPSSTVPTTKRQGIAIILLLCATLAVGLVLAYFAATNRFSSPAYEHKTVALLKQLSAPQYEYKTIDFYGKGPSREGSGAFKFTSITPDAGQLKALGAEGWEVVGTYLEMETAWPNFGSAKYVAGLQPNVRPQRLVMVLQRRVPVSD